MRWLFVVLTASCGCSDGGADDADVWRNSERCPALHPLSEANPAACSPGVECRWPAAGCEPGQKPDNVCVCGQNGWECESHFRNCLPLSEAPAQLAFGKRPMPTHRASAGVCDDPADEPRGDTCTARSGGSSGGCTSHGDCASDEVCMDSHVFGGMSACTCTSVECRTDSDCPGGLCQCGALDAATRCGGWSDATCGHSCKPTSGCRVDADCGPGRFCSPSRDICGWQVERWLCHDPDADECLSDAECGFVGSRWNSTCRADDQDRWRCEPSPTCE